MAEQAFFQLIAGELNIRAFQVSNTVELLDGGNTVPFIARYRKEATGMLDEEQIRAVEERINYLRMLEERRATILSSIEEQGKLTPELRKKIEACDKLRELEDLYLPYRPKKRTRATVAREKGLEPLAEVIIKQEVERGDAFEIAAAYIDSENGVNSAEEALAGAQDIVAEMISDDAAVRKLIREASHKSGLINSKGKSAEAETDYEMYIDFSEPVHKIVPHRILAMNRGEKEKQLGVSIEVDEDQMIDIIRRLHLKNPNTIFKNHLTDAMIDGYKRLISPSIEREIRNELTETAERHAIDVFGENLKNLLLQPPVRNKIIMGIDPAYRTGCKIAIIDETGKYLEGDTIYPHAPQKKMMQAKSTIREMCDKHNVDIIAIGNGTASRETESMTADIIAETKQDQPDRELYYIIVNEAGASVYSASKVAREEFPDLDASQRGNISIARRLLDPLSELVKIDPKSIGVGLYQHDVNQKNLGSALDTVVESAVNKVGVNLNTASASLLRHVSGLTSRTAGNIVKFRDDNGRFNSRKQLQKVSGVGDIAFQQAAGFLRIPGAKNLLDQTGIHPESYDATKKLLELAEMEDDPSRWRDIRSFVKGKNRAELATQLGVGEPTLDDIIADLEKPGRDPRDAMPKPILKSDVLNIEDLKEGMVLKGTVRNVVDFGAFVDIGVKRDGLVHISELANKFVKNPHEVVSVGDVVSVRVMEVDMQKGRVKLSMKI
ncbi:MAG: Tex family protein [Calditrichia bacterium]